MNVAAAPREAELQQLDEFLRSPATSPTCMSLDQLDGFLSALVCGPEVVGPSRYLPVVWGTDQEPAFTSTEQAKHMLLLIAALDHSIARALHRTGSYQPLLRRATDAAGQSLVFTEAWCDGFLRGVVLCRESWAPHFEQLVDYLDPILAFARDVAASDDLMAPALRARAAALAEQLPHHLAALHAYWSRPHPSA